MRPWQFSKPKNPGFGISRGYYLSVLLAKANLPSIFEIVNPKAEFGAVEGFGVPMGTDEKEALRRPLERGKYAIASKDQKTVMEMLILSKEEAGFDPEIFARSPLASTANPELVARVRGTWTLAQLTFKSHDPMVYPALDIHLSIAQRLAVLADGVVADPISQRYLLPEQVFHPDRVDPRVDARDHVTVQHRDRPDGRHAFTLGMQKFALPELEITALFAGDEEPAMRFLLASCQSVLLGNLIQAGDRVGPFEARDGGFDRALWEGIAVMELLPPTKQTSGEVLAEWERSVGRL